ncbi:hypothetical protein [Streptomyces sp. NPDC085529]|uniref:hypothetical protein n=1 Tax=Streptomyces sp. NPDC085529 TaxID=3365729 RepID=UPI0037D353CA
MVPLGIAYLRGWAPRWTPGSTRRAARARGAAALALYAGAMTPAVLGLAGVPADRLLPLRIVAGPCLTLVAIGLTLWAYAVDRRPAT